MELPSRRFSLADALAAEKQLSDLRLENDQLKKELANTKEDARLFKDASTDSFDRYKVTHVAAVESFEKALKLEDKVKELEKNNEGFRQDAKAAKAAAIYSYNHAIELEKKLANQKQEVNWSHAPHIKVDTAIEKRLNDLEVKVSAHRRVLTECIEELKTHDDRLDDLEEHTNDLVDLDDRLDEIEEDYEKRLADLENDAVNTEELNRVLNKHDKQLKHLLDGKSAFTYRD